MRHGLGPFLPRQVEYLRWSKQWCEFGSHLNSPLVLRCRKSQCSTSTKYIKIFKIQIHNLYLYFIFQRQGKRESSTLTERVKMYNRNKTIAIYHHQMARKVSSAPHFKETREQSEMVLQVALNEYHTNIKWEQYHITGTSGWYYETSSFFASGGMFTLMRCEKCFCLIKGFLYRSKLKASLSNLKKCSSNINTWLHHTYPYK